MNLSENQAKRKEGTGCHNNGNCDSCPYTDCIATAVECTHFYRDEERNARARWSLEAIRGKADKCYSE